MNSPWRSESYWLVLLTLAGLFLGKVSGVYFLSLLLAVLVYLARQIFHINRMSLWLRNGGKIPEGSGIWEEIYFLIYKLRRRNKNRKKRLIEMLERFRTATAALPDATVVLAQRDEIDWFNEAAERLLGLRKSDIGQQISNLLRASKFAEFLSATDSNGTLSISSPVQENIQLEIRIVPYGEDLRLLVAQDVTQIRFMERVRSDFVANVSHELRTPLTVMRGYLETLGEAETELPERYYKMFRRMEEQTLRMQKLIDDLLVLTKLESGTLALAQPVKIRALLSSVCSEASELKQEAQTLELEVQGETQLLGVESELRSAFSNLIVNALRYTQPGAAIKVRWRETKEGALFEVEDNGPGIAAEHLPRLTERFYRVDTAKSFSANSTGLGLAIVKHVLARHEGELSIDSALGRGSRFSCKFPAKRLIRRAA